MAGDSGAGGGGPVIACVYGNERLHTRGDVVKVLLCSNQFRIPRRRHTATAKRLTVLVGASSLLAEGGVDSLTSQRLRLGHRRGSAWAPHRRLPGAQRTAAYGLQKTAGNDNADNGDNGGPVR